MGLLCVMMWILLCFGWLCVCIVLYLIVMYFVLFLLVVCVVLCDYLCCVFGCFVCWCDVYWYVFMFVVMIYDCVYLMNGCFDLFDIWLYGEMFVDDVFVGGCGVFLMGVYFGSFEVVCVIGCMYLDLCVVVMMYEKNVCKINVMFVVVNLVV